MTRPVTEDDFRMPEYRGKRLEDYEIREDGKAVRKDRWQQAIYKLRTILTGKSRGDFEIDDVVEAARRLAIDWNNVNPEEFPQEDSIAVKLSCGSILRGLVREDELLYTKRMNNALFVLTRKEWEDGELIEGWADERDLARIEGVTTNEQD